MYDCTRYALQVTLQKTHTSAYIRYLQIYAYVCETLVLDLMLMYAQRAADCRRTQERCVTLSRYLQTALKKRGA
jgi:hypothetical protein